MHKKIIAKLLIDTLFLGTLFVGTFFIADTVLPGFLSALIPTGYVIAILSLAAFFITLHTKSFANKQKSARFIPYTLTALSLPLLYIATNNFQIIPRIAIILLGSALFYILLTGHKNPTCQESE